MRNGPAITFAGYLGGNPELRYTPNGIAVCDLRVASTPRGRIGDEWVDKETLWFEVSTWRQLAEHVAQSLNKGDRVVVTGRLLQRSYTREDGTKGTQLVVDAATVAADLDRYPVKALRPARAGSSLDTLPERWVDKETGEVHGDLTDLDAELAALEDAPAL